MKYRCILRKTFFFNSQGFPWGRWLLCRAYSFMISFFFFPKMTVNLLAVLYGTVNRGQNTLLAILIILKSAWNALWCSVDAYTVERRSLLVPCILMNGTQSKHSSKSSPQRYRTNIPPGWGDVTELLCAHWFPLYFKEKQMPEMLKKKGHRLINSKGS